MNRPVTITLLGWLGILIYLLQLIGIVLRLDGFVNPGTTPTLGIVVNVLGLVVSVSLLNGQRWARIFMTFGGLTSVCVLWFFPQEIPAVYPPAFLQATTIISSGLLLIVICLLYSPAANRFFRPQKNPIPFNNYNAARQLLIIGAFALIGYGGYLIWQIGIPDVSATSTNPDAPKPIRTFTNTQGVAIQARLIYFDGGQVILEREDGRRFTNPIAIYSESDQAYIRKESGR